jgi:hypothetical protein
MTSLRAAPFADLPWLHFGPLQEIGHDKMVGDAQIEQRAQNAGCLSLPAKCCPIQQ